MLVVIKSYHFERSRFAFSKYKSICIILLRNSNFKFYDVFTCWLVLLIADMPIAGGTVGWSFTVSAMAVSLIPSREMSYLQKRNLIK